MDNNKAFCILPWVHVNLNQNSEVYPCCRTKHNYSYGSVQKKGLKEIWNSEEIKNVRKEMLAGKAQSFCENCYEAEKIGAESPRQAANDKYRDEFSRIEYTNTDGELVGKEIIYLDIRFSNICNFKCRSCGPESSNAWYEDHQKLCKSTKDQKKTLKLTENKTLMQDIESLLPKIDKIYFAGGEPLLDENHYRLLERLIELKRCDVKIESNTNLSTLSYMQWNILNLWKKFENVIVSASIDAIGPAAELVRKGADWETIRKNLATLQRSNPEILIQISPTISIMNCFMLPELINYFIENGFIKFAQNVNFNILANPEFLSVALLNQIEIDELSIKYKNFSESLMGRVSIEVAKHIEYELALVISHAKHKDLSQTRSEFRVFTFNLDKIRGEKTIKVIPELFGLLYGEA